MSSKTVKGIFIGCSVLSFVFCIWLAFLFGGLFSSGWILVIGLGVIPPVLHHKLTILLGLVLTLVLTYNKEDFSLQEAVLNIREDIHTYTL